MNSPVPLLNLSYSSLETLHRCERLFELDKLLQPEGIGDDSLDLVCGTSFGNGLQHLLLSDNLEQSVFRAYIAWTFPKLGKVTNRVDLMESSRSITESNKKKAFFYVVRHLEKAQYTLKQHEKMKEWKLWTLPSGRPATEVGFRIKLPDGSYQRGFIDAILQHRLDPKRFAPLEVKTSGFVSPVAGWWQNSDQGNSYSFITDYITGQICPVILYFIADFPQCNQQVFDFWKSDADKVAWLPTLANDINRIRMCMDAKHFPMRGSACMDFFRPCTYLGVCNLPRQGQWRAHELEAKEKFDYDFTLEEILQIRDRLYSKAA